MCSGTDSYDIALAAEGVDICESMYDGDGIDPSAQNKLNYSNTLAFKDFLLERDPMKYEYSDIDGTHLHRSGERLDNFTLFDFSAKWDVVPTMLTQCHVDIVPGFMGQTTDFKKNSSSLMYWILGESKEFGTRTLQSTVNSAKGLRTFYGGHDPEDYQHRVGDPPTDFEFAPQLSRIQTDFEQHSISSCEEEEEKDLAE